MIVVPYFAVMMIAFLEGMLNRHDPHGFGMIAGSLWFGADPWVRSHAHMNIAGSSPMGLKTIEDDKISRIGLYASFRHQLYLANVLLFIACPLFMGVQWS